jgi:hypothetical protein
MKSAAGVEAAVRGMKRSSAGIAHLCLWFPRIPERRPRLQAGSGARGRTSGRCWSNGAGRYVASDINPLYLDTLRGLQTNRPYLSAAYCDVNDLASSRHTAAQMMPPISED